MKNFKIIKNLDNIAEELVSTASTLFRGECYTFGGLVVSNLIPLTQLQPLIDLCVEVEWTLDTMDDEELNRQTDLETLLSGGETRFPSEKVLMATKDFSNRVTRVLVLQTKPAEVERKKFRANGLKIPIQVLLSKGAGFIFSPLIAQSTREQMAEWFDGFPVRIDVMDGAELSRLADEHADLYGGYVRRESELEVVLAFRSAEGRVMRVSVWDDGPAELSRTSIPVHRLPRTAKELPID